ncbi:hypothetical protein [Sulfurimonas sp.]|uniref:hypothetical protein n=1 Tax=Sulfurimonas sp. TaxID=2022749 RepID=UPI0026015FC9|nr:hypothetical protein [Sulfurimonas sp.]
MEKSINEMYHPDFISKIEGAGMLQASYHTFQSMIDMFKAYDLELTPEAQNQLVKDIDNFLETTRDEYLENKVKRI